MTVQSSSHPARSGSGRAARGSAAHVAVIGAGVIGLSVAVEAASRGFRVTLIEQGTPGAGTSSTSYAWVNSNNKTPTSYYELNLAGLNAHHELARRTGGEWLVTTGHLEVATSPAHREELRARTDRMRELGYDAESVSAKRAVTLVPDLVSLDEVDATYFPREAYCLPQLYVAHLLGRAREAGVVVRGGVRVDVLDDHGGAPLLHLSDGTTLAPDLVVTCAGRWTNHLLRRRGLAPMADFVHPGDVTVGYLATTNPLPVALTRLLTTSALNIRPDGGGRLLLQALDLDSTADPRDVPEPGSDLAERFVRRLQRVLAHTDGAHIAEFAVGQRSMPHDGLTVAGTHPEASWLYIVATHSGITLAPLLGTSVATELAGEDAPLLAPFRPARLGGSDAASLASTQPLSAPREPGQQ